MRLSVIIVNYNSGPYLEQCVASMAQKFGGLEYEVIIVDNASTDGSITAATRADRHTAFIMSETNMGFAAACNVGADIAIGEYLLFLNPDTRILSDNIDALLEAFKADTAAGALGCQNRRPDGSMQSSAYGFPTLFLAFAWAFRLRVLLHLPGVKTLLIPFLKGRFGQFDPHSRSKPVDYVTGAFLLVKRFAWYKTGPFDRRFFLFCEEIDWCLRCKRAGFNVVFDPSFEIEHYVGYSSQKEKPRVLLEKFMSYRRYFEKHHPGPKSAILNGIFAVAVRFWALYYKMIGNREYANAYKGIKSRLELDEG